MALIGEVPEPGVNEFANKDTTQQDLDPQAQVLADALSRASERRMRLVTLALELGTTAVKDGSLTFADVNTNDDEEIEDNEADEAFTQLMDDATNHLELEDVNRKIDATRTEVGRLEQAAEEDGQTLAGLQERYPHLRLYTDGIASHGELRNVRWNLESLADRRGILMDRLGLTDEDIEDDEESEEGSISSAKMANGAAEPEEEARASEDDEARS